MEGYRGIMIELDDDCLGFERDDRGQYHKVGVSIDVLRYIAWSVAYEVNVPDNSQLEHSFWWLDQHDAWNGILLK